MIALLPITRENFDRFEKDIVFIERCSFPSPWDERSFSSEIDREVSHFWAAAMEDVLAGYICFWLYAGEVHLLNIAVHTGCRRQRIGSSLLSKMLEVGRSRDAATAWLEVRPSNHAARSLYRKTGFREVGRRPRYYDDTGEAAIIMCLRLNDHQYNP
jgi:[ribosomal protein S18]-alanine N-acetyltransferase